LRGAKRRGNLKAVGSYKYFPEIAASALWGLLAMTTPDTWMVLEQKTGKRRVFTVPLVIAQYIENYCLMI